MDGYANVHSCSLYIADNRNVNLMGGSTELRREIGESFAAINTADQWEDFSLQVLIGDSGRDMEACLPG